MSGVNPQNSTQQIIQSLPHPLIDLTPQVNQELPCWRNYEEEEGDKAGKGEDRIGDFCHSEGWRDQ